MDMLRACMIDFGLFLQILFDDWLSSWELNFFYYLKSFLIVLFIELCVEMG